MSDDTIRVAERIELLTAETSEGAQSCSVATRPTSMNWDVKSARSFASTA